MEGRERQRQRQRKTDRDIKRQSEIQGLRVTERDIAGGRSERVRKIWRAGNMKAVER